MKSKEDKNKPDSKVDKSYLFQPGQSGNPGGRPLRNKALSENLRQMLAAKEVKIKCEIKGSSGKTIIREWELKSDHDLNAVVSMSLIEQAVDGNIQAINLIFDRIEGKAIQTNLIADVNSEFSNMSIEDKKAKLAAFLERELD